MLPFVMDNLPLNESVYLDYNIVYGLTEDTIQADDVYACIGKDTGIAFPYSDAHIFEVSNIPIDYPNRAEIVRLRLNGINTMSGGFSLWRNDNDPNSIFYGDRDPYELFKIVEKDQDKKKAIKTMSNWIGEDSRKSVREWMGMDSREINNFDEDAAIQYLSRLTSQNNMTPIEFIHHTRTFHPQPEMMGLHNDMAALFELLDLVGYWRDRYHANSNYGRTWDAQHAAFGGYCHYFVTQDRNTFYKAKVAYKLFGLKTKTLHFVPKKV